MAIITRKSIGIIYVPCRDKEDKERWKLLVSAIGLLVWRRVSNRVLREVMRELERGRVVGLGSLFPTIRSRRCRGEVRPVGFSSYPAMVHGIAALVETSRAYWLKPAEAAGAFIHDERYGEELTEMVELPSIFDEFDEEVSEDALNWAKYEICRGEEIDWIPSEDAVARAVAQVSEPSPRKSSS